MKGENKILNTVILSVAIGSVGLSLKSGIENFRDRERVVSVKGLAEREVWADHVIWPIFYNEYGNNLQEIYQNLEVKNKRIIAFLTEKGIKKEDISLSAPEIKDLQADIYLTQKNEFRYHVSMVLTVSSDDVKLVRELISSQGDLLQQGIAILTDNYRYNVDYQYNALNEIKPEMIQQATENARAAAEKFAQDSQSNLGKIRTANQGTFTIYNRDEATPFIKKVRVVSQVDYYLVDWENELKTN